MERQDGKLDAILDEVRSIPERILVGDATVRADLEAQIASVKIEVQRHRTLLSLISWAGGAIGTTVIGLMANFVFRGR